ncbi:rhamnogalacturonan acetylesterase [Neobacillus drentensis]|uniref:rhamnogalacturonan acetylesterase n=1 Tax=Neobacillus drentensis TaxID=220684 RepID=UPI002FFE67C9
MRKKVIGKLLIAILFLLVFGLIARNSMANKANDKHSHKNHITVYLAGDSTVADYLSSSAPRAGWGQGFNRFFDDRIVVRNMAKSGRSSKSFIDEGRLDSILKQIDKGDYLFIQFGHNDEIKKDPTRFTEPNGSYKSYLKQYIDGARAKQALPVLVTPVERRSFSKDGTALDSHGEYPAAMKELGLEEHVPVIDLTAKSKQLFQELGPEETREVFMWLDAGKEKNYPDGIQDNVHFQQAGAELISRLVLEGVKELKLVPLQNHIIK